MIGLPYELEVNGIKYRIRTNYRDILKIFQAFNDPELDIQEKCYVCLYILYEDFNRIPENDIEEAYEQARWFIDCGDRFTDEKKENIKLMDWEQDEAIIFPAINRVAGHETRLDKYIHWWTFMGYYMEIGECLFNTVISIRAKHAKHKKLEKYESEFYKENKKLIDLKRVLSKEEQDEYDMVMSLISDNKMP